MSRENTNFLNAAKKQRETFATELNNVHDWQTMDKGLKASIENFMQFYDEFYNRMSQMDKVFIEVDIDINLAEKIS